MNSKSLSDLRRENSSRIFGPFEVVTFTKLLDETVNKNTAIFNWSDMDTIFQFIEKHNTNFNNGFLLTELSNRFMKERDPYVIFRGILVFENIAKKYKYTDVIMSQSIIQMMIDVFIDATSTRYYENVRRKIQRLFHGWLYGNYINSILMMEIEFMLKIKGFEISREDKIVVKNTPLGYCYKCEKHELNVICAACIQLFCNECCKKTLALQQFEIREQVRVCKDCFISENEEILREGPSKSETQVELRHPIEETANAAFIKSIECPVCLDVIKKPVIICKSGHSMCQICTIGKVISCPVCRGEITSTRNYVLEDLLENQKANCIFTTEGCNTIVKLQEKETHEAECEFRPIQCIGKQFCKWQCNWLGSSNKMTLHFSEVHQKNIIPSRIKSRAIIAELNVNLISSRDLHNIQLVNFREGKKYFWCKHKVDPVEKIFYCTVQLIGSKEEAANYCYEIAISKALARNLKIMEICENDVVDATKIFESKKCFVVPFDTLKMYANEKNNVFCTLSILNILQDLY